MKLINQSKISQYNKVYCFVSSPAVYKEVCVVRMLIMFAFRQKQSGATEDYRFVMALGKVSISKICHIKFGIFFPPLIFQSAT